VGFYLLIVDGDNFVVICKNKLHNRKVVTDSMAYTVKAKEKQGLTMYVSRKVNTKSCKGNQKIEDFSSGFYTSRTDKGAESCGVRTIIKKGGVVL